MCRHRKMITLAVMKLCCVLCLVLLVGASASADSVVTYSNLAAWQVAVNNTTTLDFNSAVASNGILIWDAGPQTLAGITFTATTPTDMYVVGPNNVPSPNIYEWGTGAVFSFQHGDPNSVTLAFPAGTSAVGFDFGLVTGFGGNPYGIWTGGNLTVQLSTGHTYTAAAAQTSPPANNLSWVFFGFASDTPVDWIKISGQYDAMLDNISYGTTVPEPATILLLGSGLLGIIGAARRKTR